MHTYPNVSCLIFSSWYELLNKPSMLFDPGLLNMSQIVQSKELTGFYHLRHCYNCYNYLFYYPQTVPTPLSLHRSLDHEALLEIFLSPTCILYCIFWCHSTFWFSLA